MFTDQQNDQAINWMRKAVGSDINDLVPSIEEVAGSEDRKRRFLLWALWAEPKLDELEKDILNEFLYRFPMFVDLENSFLRGALLLKEKTDLSEKMEKGSSCPVCGQFCKEYKRSFNTNQAIFLRSLVKKSLKDEGDGWIHHSELEYTGRDYTLTAQWGLATTSREQPDKDGRRKKRSTGLWKPTQKGIDFVKGITKIPFYLYMFDGKVRHDEDAPLISFVDALGEPFEYSQLFDNVLTLKTGREAL